MRELFELLEEVTKDRRPVVTHSQIAQRRLNRKAKVMKAALDFNQAIATPLPELGEMVVIDQSEPTATEYTGAFLEAVYCVVGVVPYDEGRRDPASVNRNNGSLRCNVQLLSVGKDDKAVLFEVPHFHLKKWDEAEDIAVADHVVEDAEEVAAVG